MMSFEPVLKDGSMLVDEAEFAKVNVRDWLAGDTSYQSFVESLSDSDPRLRIRDPKAVLQKIPWTDHGRVVIMEMGGNGSFGPAIEFRDVDKLRDHVAHSGCGQRSPRKDSAVRSDSESLKAPPRRRLFIMESMGPGYVSVLGEHLGIHPSAFLDHERVIVMNTAAQGQSDGMLLPSVSCTASTSTSHINQRHITLKYFETLQIDRRPDNFRLVCGDSGRHIGVSRTDGQFTDVGVARRKCTMWSKLTAKGGWDCEFGCYIPTTKTRTNQGKNRSRNMRSRSAQCPHWL